MCGIAIKWHKSLEHLIIQTVALTDLQAWPEYWTPKEQFWPVSQSHRPKQTSKLKLSKTQAEPSDEFSDQFSYWMLNFPTHL